MYEFDDFNHLKREELDHVFEHANQPDFEKLAGYEFRGMNTNIMTPLLGIKKFVKVFDTTHQEEQFGYNLRVRQNKLKEAHIVKKNKKGSPLTQGFYAVHNTTAHPDYKHALVIDYDCKWNHKWDVTRSLIDYLVKVHPENDDLYLGKAFLRFGQIKVFVSYFILERKAPIEIHVKP